MSIEQSQIKSTPREKLGGQKTRMLIGYQVADLPYVTKVKFASQIYAALAENQDRMRQFAPFELIEGMNEERFVLKVGEQNELLACAQVWPFPANPSIIEVGTWKSFKVAGYENGSGAMVMEAAAKFAMTFPEAAMVIALVQEDNITAQVALTRIGGLMQGYRYSDYVKPEGKPALMKVFNLINLVEK